MSRFAYVEGQEYINTEEIVRWYPAVRGGNHFIFIEYKDGATSSHPRTSYTEEELEGSNYIVQVIPCHNELYSVWRTGDNEYCSSGILYLGLTASGELKPLDMADGYFCVTNDSNFLGIYQLQDLKNFPGAERSPQ